MMTGGPAESRTDGELPAHGADRSTPEPRQPRRVESFGELVSEVRRAVEARLSQLLDSAVDEVRPCGPDAALAIDGLRALCMRGGKRFRPVLVGAAYEGCGGDGAHAGSLSEGGGARGGGDRAPAGLPAHSRRLDGRGRRQARRAERPRDAPQGVWRRARRRCGGDPRGGLRVGAGAAGAALDPARRRPRRGGGTGVRARTARGHHRAAPRHARRAGKRRIDERPEDRELHRPWASRDRRDPRRRHARPARRAGSLRGSPRDRLPAPRRSPRHLRRPARDREARGERPATRQAHRARGRPRGGREGSAPHGPRARRRRRERGRTSRRSSRASSPPGPGPGSKGAFAISSRRRSESSLRRRSLRRERPGCRAP